MTAAEKIAAVREPPVQKPKSANLPDREYYTVPDRAKSLGVDQDKILGWIHRGELLALNVAESATGRPRWRIPKASWEAFTAARSNQSQAPAPVPRVPRRRRRDRYVMKFY